MKSVTSLVVLMGCCALTGCASQAPTAPAGAAANAGSTSAAAVAASTDQKPIPSGYTRTVVNGVEKFCRVDTFTGSRAQRSQVCLTRAQLADVQNNGQDFIRDVQRRSATSSTLSTPGQGGAMGGR